MGWLFIKVDIQVSIYGQLIPLDVYYVKVRFVETY